MPVRKLNKINIITLGCSKNLVDSEVLMRQLDENGFEFVHDSGDTGIKTVIINTCGFINEAKEESVNTILQYVQAKQEGKIEKLYIIGCLSQRYKNELELGIPEVDKYFGVNNIRQIINELGGRYKHELLSERILTTPSHYAYLKISEGCNRKCSFCAIPMIRGKQKSKPVEKIISETKFLISQGLKELILIAQDLTAYGTDLYGEQKLAELLDVLAELDGIEWIRLLYTYPANFPEKILDIILKHPTICNYIDIPFQHISDRMLSKMQRGIDRAGTLSLIRKIRETIPGIAIRTTLLVGHPGEGDNEFMELKEFVKEQRFERLGVFKYSEEEGTYSEKQYKNDISDKAKHTRFKQIMEIQKDISLNINKYKVGKTLRVVIDSVEGRMKTGRTEFDSPEVDNEVHIIDPANKLKPGEFYNVLITGADEYDLYGEPVL